MEFTSLTAATDGCMNPLLVPDGKGDQIRNFRGRFIDVSPDGRILAFSAEKNKSQNIWFKYLDGGNALTQRSFGSHNFEVSFAPGSAQFAFSKFQENTMNIVQMNTMEGSAVKQISATEAAEHNPFYSPDGKVLYYTKYEKTELESKVTEPFVWGYDLMKGMQTQFTKGYLPATTPDGNNLLVTRTAFSGGNQREEIWMINLVTGVETQLFTDPKRSFANPQVSPDGSKVVFESFSFVKKKDLPKNWDIYVANTDGSGLTQITFHHGNDLCPRWSPDGSEIYFLSQRNQQKGNYNVWKIKYQR